MDFLRKVQQMLERDEGRRAIPYVDTEGHLTVGIGHNLDEPLHPLLIDAIFQHDLHRHLDELLTRWPFVEFFDEARKAALFNMAFQLGTPRLGSFRKMWAALEARDWKEARACALDSKWAKQTPERAQRVANQLWLGEWT